VASLRVQLVIDRGVTPPKSLHAALRRVNACVSMRSFDKALAVGVSESADVCVVLPSAERSAEVIDRFVASTSDRACATLVLPTASRSNGTPVSRATDLAVPDRMANASRPARLNADELAGRIRALCEIRHPLRKMREELDQLKRGGAVPEPSPRVLDEQIRLATQIQDDLLPVPMADTVPLSITSLYVPADFVSGDTYDVARLDARHFSFSIADATGHGLPAAMLALTVRHALRGKQAVDGASRIVEPEEVLTRLNAELCASNLRQCQFVTALHAVFDRHSAKMRWARGGVPYPILIRPGRRPCLLRTEGGLLGAVEHMSFETAEHTMEAGDLLLFYTDGLESLLLDRRTPRGGDALLDTDWMKCLADEGAEQAFERARTLAAEKHLDPWLRDDITALAIAMH
jgi:serine phosphatase RsbU (regulator of sigma subunit)